VPDRKIRFRRVGSRLRHRAARQVCLSNRQVLSRTNHGVVFLGADSLVTVSTVIQQSITGVVHRAACRSCAPHWTRSAGRKGGGKDVPKCWYAGLRPGVETVVNVPAELKAMELLFGAVQLDDTVLRPDSWLACPVTTRCTCPLGRKVLQTTARLAGGLSSTG